MASSSLEYFNIQVQIYYDFSTIFCKILNFSALFVCKKCFLGFSFNRQTKREQMSKIGEEAEHDKATGATTNLDESKSFNRQNRKKIQIQVKNYRFNS